jgi:hypothetical protein
VFCCTVDSRVALFCVVSASLESFSSRVCFVTRKFAFDYLHLRRRSTRLACLSDSSSHFVFRYMLFILFALVTVWFFAILLVRRRTFVRLLLHDLALSNVTGDFDLPLEAGELAIDCSFFNDVLVASLGDM